MKKIVIATKNEGKVREMKDAFSVFNVEVISLKEFGNLPDAVEDGKTFEDMTNNRMCFHAVVYNIMIIGEAANMLTKEFRDENQDTPWRDIIDMRNVLVHGYYIASPKFVWDTYVNDLPILKQQVEDYLKVL